MGLLDGVKKDSIGKKEEESIVNILPTIKPMNEDEMPEYPFDGNDPDDKIKTDADAKRAIALAIIESEKVVPKKKKKKTAKKTAKKSTKKTTKKKGKKIVLKKKPKDDTKMDVKPKPPLKKKDIKKKEEEEQIPEIKNEIIDITPTSDLVQYKPAKVELPLRAYPSDEEVLFLINRRNYIKEHIVDKEKDYMEIKGNEYMLKSGWRKFISGFALSVELLSKRVFERFSDVHAEVVIRVTAPNGQTVEGIGIKSMKDLYAGSRNLHNLVATAWTRAVNRGVSDLVGGGEVSAEEMQTDGKSPLF